MKKHAAIFAALLLTGTATAQTGKLELGVQAGPSLISMRGNDFVNNLHDPGIGFAAGLALQYNLTENVSLRVDPGFERKGSTVRAIFSDASGNQTGELTLHQNFDYITLPVLVRAAFGQKHKFFANAGPYAAYLARYSETSRSNNLPEGTYNPQQVYLRDFDFGVTAGAGFVASISEKISLSAELRNSLGLKNISQAFAVGNGVLKTNATSLLVGIGYKL